MPRTLVEDMVPLLGDRDLSSKDKVRIIALYILYRDGVPEEDRKRLFQHARLAMHEQDMVNNLRYLGLDISKELKTSRRAPLKQKQLEDAYDISRYQPMIKLMLDVSRLISHRIASHRIASRRHETPADAAVGTLARRNTSRTAWIRAHFPICAMHRLRGVPGARALPP